MDAAWFLVKELKKVGYSCEVQEAEAVVAPAAAFAKGKLYAFVHDSHTAAEAICRAALEVVKLEKRATGKRV